MQISGEDNENLLMDMVLEKKKILRYISKKRSFHQHFFLNRNFALLQIPGDLLQHVQREN
jgi:hypothetical protein